ncbi:MAG: hypothetical protein HUJ51_06565 [Eggerthellaceae bacterium]|nr:hypothetical protein [Eggerthellaceae bacterium]
MAQRNPMNERYTVEGNMPGKTRKSASSVKPKTKASGTVIETKKKKKGTWKASQKTKDEKRQEREASREERLQIDQIVAKAQKPPRYKLLRKIWTVSLIVAIMCTLAAFVINFNSETFLRVFAKDQAAFDTFKTVFLVMAYVSIILTLFLDFFPIKKERLRMEDKARAQYRANKKSELTGVNKKKRDLAEYERKQCKAKLAQQVQNTVDSGNASIIGKVTAKVKCFGKKKPPKHAPRKK